MFSVTVRVVTRVAVLGPAADQRRVVIFTEDGPPERLLNFEVVRILSKRTDPVL